MKKLMNVQVAMAVLGLGAASSFAEIKLGDNLSIAGFLDMSSSYNTSAEKLAAEIDQFEIDFMYKYGEHISARADVAQGGLSGGANTIALESGYITYTGGPLSVSAGRFLSMSGWEAAEPTSTYQYSYNEALSYFGALNLPGAYGGYENGVNVMYNGGMYSLYGAYVTSIWGPYNDASLQSPAFEGQLAVMPTKEITAKVTYMAEDETHPDSAGGDYYKQVINAWASYTMGPIILAGEYDHMMSFLAKDNSDGNGWLAFVNYRFMPKLAVTLRYSGVKIDGMSDPQQEVTFSPTYNFADNWWILAEARQELSGPGYDSSKASYFGLETTFTF